MRLSNRVSRAGKPASPPRLQRVNVGLVLCWLSLAMLQGCETQRVSATPEAPWNQDANEIFEADLGNGWREFGGHHEYFYRSGLSQPESVLARTTTTSTGSTGSVYRRSKIDVQSDEIYLVYDQSDIELRSGWKKYWPVYQPRGTRRNIERHPLPLVDGDLRLFISLPAQQWTIHLPIDAITDDELSDADDGKPGSDGGSLRYELSFQSIDNSAQSYTARVRRRDGRAYTWYSSEPDASEPVTFGQTRSTNGRATIEAITELLSQSDVTFRVYRLLNEVEEGHDYRRKRGRVVYEALLPKPKRRLLETSAAHYAER